jgi:hypothetical protein
MSDVRAEVERALAQVEIPASALVGCSEQEVEALERKFGLRLPASYRAFLRLCGREMGPFCRGTDMFYPAIEDGRGGLVELLAEGQVHFELSSDEFVFMSHQGYVYCFFSCSDGHDPPVRQYVELDEAPKVVAGSFTGWLRDVLSDEVRHF